VDVEHEIKDLKDLKALRGYRLRNPLWSLGIVLVWVCRALGGMVGVWDAVR
jgi:hypothetical protein